MEDGSDLFLPLADQTQHSGQHGAQHPTGIVELRVKVEGFNSIELFFQRIVALIKLCENCAGVPHHHRRVGQQGIGLMLSDEREVEDI